MAARLILRALTAQGSRIGVAVGAILVGAAVISALTSLYLDISRKMSEELRAYGPNMILTPHASEDEDVAVRGVDIATVQAALDVLPADRRLGSTPFLYGMVRLPQGTAVLVGANMQGLRAISPYWQVEGGWVTADFDERNAMVGRRLADSLGLELGDTVPLRADAGTAPAEVTIKGIVETGEAEDDQIFVNLSLAQRLLNRPGQADLAMASLVAQGPEADALAAEVMKQVPALDVRPIRKVSQNDGEVLDRIDGLMALVAGIILVITTLCVNATLTAMVAERTPQIGLQKAIGASNRSIVGQVLTETAVIALIAGTLGLALGFVLAQGLGQAVFHAWVGFRPVVVPLTLGLCLGAALLAAILPVRGAVRVVPAQVLRGD
ncbi:ABC transporter permease [Roseospira marina]|uniref:ABC transporter permease n=2 Tax=Roseospira marina TaxID=140057 RepID=A0A5M6ICU9_9PROT|nr:ABC transporter permease [Roseospira marina]